MKHRRKMRKPRRKIRSVASRRAMKAARTRKWMRMERYHAAEELKNRVGMLEEKIKTPKWYLRRFDIDKLDLRPGDVLVIKPRNGVVDDDTATKISNYFQSVLSPAIKIWVCAENTDFVKLSAHEPEEKNAVATNGK